MEGAGSRFLPHLPKPDKRCHKDFQVIASNVADKSLISSHHSSVPATAAAVRTTASAANANTTNSELNSSFGSNGPGECTVCYENIVDCVLYTCGHMCMCFDCAIKQWKGQGQGFCPICRSQIRDVIKTFRS